MHSKALFLHWLALLLTFLGSAAIFLENWRLNTRLPPKGLFIGDPIGWESWIYHRGLQGTALILVAILLQGIAIFMDHRAFHQATHNA